MKMNIRTKLIGGFGLVIVMLVVVFGIGWNGLNSLDAAADEIVHEQLPKDVEIRDLQLQIALQGELYMEYALTGEEEFLHEAREKTNVILEEAADLEERLDGEPELLSALQQVELEFTQLNREEEEFVSLYISGDIAEAIEHLHLVAAEEAQIEEELATLAHEIELGMEESFQAAEGAHDRAVQMMIAVTVLAVMVALAVAFLISQGISNGAAAINRILQQIAAGDLRTLVNVKSSDEIGDMGRSCNEMIVNLRELIGQVTDSTTSLTETSSQLANAAEQAGNAVQGIASTSQQVAKGAEDQQDRSQEVTSGMGQLSNAIEQVATSSQEQAAAVQEATAIVAQVSHATAEVASSAQAAADGSRQAREAADSGRDMVVKTMEGMERIKEAVDTASAQIAGLGEQSAEIGKIVTVIDDIAAQTNLLALNAAIEVARAGEQGRGFAVVADEVRKLAERVTDATKEIANLIDGVQKGVDESVKATEDGTREVGEGAELAAEASKSLDQILGSVQSVAGQVEQISAAAEQVSASSDEMVKTIDGINGSVEQNSAATQQMSANSTQVNQSMDTVASITEQNGAAIQEMSASSEEMSAQVQEVVAASQSLDSLSQDLKQAVGAFNMEGTRKETASAREE